MSLGNVSPCLLFLSGRRGHLRVFGPFGLLGSSRPRPQQLHVAVGQPHHAESKSERRHRAEPLPRPSPGLGARGACVFVGGGGYGYISLGAGFHAWRATGCGVGRRPNIHLYSLTLSRVARETPSKVAPSRRRNTPTRIRRIALHRARVKITAAQLMTPPQFSIYGVVSVFTRL